MMRNWDRVKCRLTKSIILTRSDADRPVTPKDLWAWEDAKEKPKHTALILPTRSGATVISVTAARVNQVSHFYLGRSVH